MDLILKIIINLWETYSWEFSCFTISVVAWAVMDYVRDEIPEDTGYFSHKTGPDKKDIWHDLKRIALGSFMFGAIGYAHFLYLISNPIIAFILIAYFGQRIFYNWSKKLKRKLSIKKVLDK